VSRRHDEKQWEIKIGMPAQRLLDMIIPGVTPARRPAFGIQYVFHVPFHPRTFVLRSDRSFTREIEKAPSESVVVIVITRLENVAVVDYCGRLRRGRSS
jgi:hypothetical protein